MQICGIPIDAKRRDVEWPRAGDMRTVHQHRNPARAALRRDHRHRQHERRLCGDVIDDDQLRMRCERPDDRLHHVAGVAHRVLEVDRLEGRAATVTDGRGRERDRAVRQIGNHHIIARTKRQRAKYRVQTGRDVGDEHEIVRTRAEERCHLIAGFAQARHGAPWHRLMSIQFAQHESRRLAFHFIAERLLFLQDAPRGRAHGAVIEVRAFWIEQPVLEHAAAQGRHPRTLPGALLPAPVHS